MGLHLSKRKDVGGDTSRQPSRSPPRSPVQSPRSGRDPWVTFQPPPAVDNSFSALTWNVASVNNNPFEYWISYDDPAYVTLMKGVECFLDDPAEYDVPVRTVFTDAMFAQLKAMMEARGIQGADEVEVNAWAGGSLNLASRKIVTEFIKDKTLGAKRLISMPDRVTNTLNVVTRRDSGYNPPPVCRPAVINNFEGDLSMMDVWWESWKKFMFQDPLTVRTRLGNSVMVPAEMLEPIPRSKYPAVTDDEERLAIPLQILCLAIFDAIIIHFMNLLSPDDTWQCVKSKICHRLYRQKNQRCLEILCERYSGVEVMFLQETAAVFKDVFDGTSLAATHDFYMPMKVDGKRDQNSVMIFKKGYFKLASINEITNSIAGRLAAHVKLAAGDLLALEAERNADGKPFILVSFHGDTDGRLTAPVLQALAEVAQEKYPNHAIVNGLDANCYERPEDDKKMPFDQLIAEIHRLGMQTCWGDAPVASQCRTTCSARTSLQPQLNKAVRYIDRAQKADKNPKDTIAYSVGRLMMVESCGRQRNPIKDNTGKLVYKEDYIFPTFDFPSDHGIVAVCLKDR